MVKLGKRGYATLKAIHLFFVSTWLGGWLSLLLILLLALGNTAVIQILETERLIHLVIVVPSVIGSLVTGILFSAKTNWAFFKHNWINIKYAINIFPIVAGALIFLPHLNGMINIAQNNPSAVLSSPVFIYDRNVDLIFLAIQFIFLVVAVYLSVFKPKIGPREIH